MNHPGIVTIHDIRSDAGIGFIVMEHVEGKTLVEVDRAGIRREGLVLGGQGARPMDHPVVRRLFRTVAWDMRSKLTLSARQVTTRRNDALRSERQ
jgi:hypothetical protein